MYSKQTDANVRKFLNYETNIYLFCSVGQMGQYQIIGEILEFRQSSKELDLMLNIR